MMLKTKSEIEKGLGKPSKQEAFEAIIDFLISD